LKIALTGHSSGFGPYVYQALKDLGHEVIGFSRSNGYDLSTQEGRSAALKASEDCEVFINNSTIGGYQSELLDEWVSLNKSHSKKIINISSYLVHVKNPTDSVYSEWVNKKKLNETHNALKNINCTYVNHYFKCESKIITWGYWKNHDFVKHHPELLTNMSIKEAIQELVDAL